MLRKLSCVSAILILITSAAQAVTIDLVPVGNPGNAADQDYGGQGQFGAVDYVYQVGKYEVTNAQYHEFLAAKAVTDTYGLYNESMASDARGGITRLGSPGSYTYAVKSAVYENMPVTYVCWYDTVRFANWLQNGQHNGDTESGTYTITGGGVNTGTVAIPNAATRATWTTKHWVLPSENEWYKAAYHQPAAQGGDTDNYWFYPTATNLPNEPYSDQPPGSDAPVQANTANFYKHDGLVNGYDDGYAVTGSASYVHAENYLTDVGEYTLSDSFYGTFDQGGNVWEWNEALIDDHDRGVRGGSWWETAAYGLAASSRYVNSFPSSELVDLGFRVASVPEPGSLAMMIGAVISLLAYAWRRRR